MKPLEELTKNTGYSWLIKQGIMQLYPWDILSNENEDQSREIKKEFTLETRNPNNSIIKNMVPFAVHQCQDDYAGFIVKNGEVTEKVLVVHLTWRGDTEINDYPDIVTYSTIWEWLEKRVVGDLSILEDVASTIKNVNFSDKYTPIKTELGFLYGRDCIYLNKTEYGFSLVLYGKINGNLCSNEQKNRFISYKLTFKEALAVSIIELDSMYDSDSWKAESCFDEVMNSSWVKELKGKVTSNHRHFSLQTYDDVFEVVCESYKLEVLASVEEEIVSLTDAGKLKKI